jgi:hypothetical protein
MGQWFGERIETKWEFVEDRRIRRDELEIKTW